MHNHNIHFPLKKRISSTIDNKTERCKLSVVAEAVASCSEALPVSRTSPYEEHFHPAPSAGTTRERLSSRSVGNPFQTIQVIPLENQVRFFSSPRLFLLILLMNILVGDQARKARQVGLLPAPSICEKGNTPCKCHSVSSWYSPLLAFLYLYTSPSLLQWPWPWSAIPYQENRRPQFA